MGRFKTLLLLLMVVSACRNHDKIAESNYDNDSDTYDPELADIVTFPDWSEQTHSNTVDPDYSVVFAQGEVLRIDITISTTSWSAMWSDLSQNLGSSGFGNMGGGVTDLDFTPLWVPCTITYNDTDWYQVGVRFKGNSSLSTAYSSGTQKLSFKLDFDQYEDSYPALTNQRFYGFKQLNLNNNYNDESLMREKVVSDLFRDFGVASANTSFCEIYVDYGSGAEYFGLYTIIEEVDDTVISTQFSDGSGNLYKPEDDAGSFKSGTYNESEFCLKTNTNAANYSDVRALYDALHDESRTSNTQQWMSTLESLFNVDMFLKWLAANTVIQNWDTYGNMAHNYFLYNNPENGLLTWIPWDNNEALQDGDSSIDADELSRVSSSWPLINYLIAIDEYKEIYNSYLQEFIDSIFIPADLISQYEEYYYLLKAYAYAEESGRTFLESDSDFDSAVSTLKSHAQSRYNTITSYLK